LRGARERAPLRQAWQAVSGPFAAVLQGSRHFLQGYKRATFTVQSDTRESPAGRARYRPAGLDLEDALVAGAVKVVMLGTISDRTREMRALLTEGNEPVL